LQDPSLERCPAVRGEGSSGKQDRKKLVRYTDFERVMKLMVLNQCQNLEFILLLQKEKSIFRAFMEIERPTVLSPFFSRGALFLNIQFPLLRNRRVS
jgi:hypothetical protein